MSVRARTLGLRYRNRPARSHGYLWEHSMEIMPSEDKWIMIGVAVWKSRILALGVAAFYEAILFIMMIPMMLTLAAKLDKKGRWVVIAGGVFTLSVVVGPIAGGALIKGVGYEGIALLQFFTALPAVYIFVQVNRIITNPLFRVTIKY